VDIISEITKVETGTPASEQAIANAERDIGFRFPALLRDLYLKVANGGVGPGYQILGVKGGHTSDEGDSISELYVVFSGADPEDPSWQWPKGIVPFCHWGCAIYSCFDATKENYPVVWFDPNNRAFGEPMELQFIPHRDSLESWFKGWLDGTDLWAETYGT
jgi:SMI1 / KNR4 family (SUKH-1)